MKEIRPELESINIYISRKVVGATSIGAFLVNTLYLCIPLR